MMKRKDRIFAAYNAEVTGGLFNESISLYVDGFFKLDQKGGDITSDLLISPSDRSVAKIYSKSKGMISGIRVIQAFLVLHGFDFEVSYMVSDGDLIDVGDVLLEISGSTLDILRVERTLLNFIMRLSGVSTGARDFVRDVGGACFLASTRKTIWGVLDKYAVMIGGGLGHRFSLSDAILVKDTHLWKISRDFKLLFEKLISVDFTNVRFLEVELESYDDFVLMAPFIYDFLKKAPPVELIVMFDNMNVVDISRCLNLARSKQIYERILFEASGAINSMNISGYAKSGIDVISMSYLTLGANNLDFSLRILK